MKKKEEAPIQYTDVNLYTDSGTERSDSLPVFKSFVDDLLAAGQCVGIFYVKNANAEDMRCTCWLITDDLVVVPEYAFELGDKEFACAFITATGNMAPKIKAKLLIGPKKRTEFSLDITGSALFRLEKPFDKPGLRLEMQSVRMDKPFYILQYPLAVPPLRISFGNIVRIHDRYFDFSAKLTDSGSGGAPVLNMDGKVIGMHVAANDEIASAINLHVIFETLRRSDYWHEIARHHNLAVESRPVASKHPTVRQTVVGKGILIDAALKWEFKKDDYPVAQQNLLKPIVVNPKADTWSLKASEREKIIKSTNVKTIINAGKNIPRSHSPHQGVISDIIAGPPYSLREVSEEHLPYWMQAVRWFNPVIPSLPTASVINQELRRRRLRSNLRQVGGAEFRGRTDELKQLRDWYRDANQGAMVVSGIGGIGKSSLIANFLLERPETTLLFWLDFDRADLAPDDGESIVSLLIEQLSVQDPKAQNIEMKEGAWEKAAVLLGSRIASAAKSSQPPILVMDGFEVAQHERRYHEIWDTLEKIMSRTKNLKVIVSGRAPVDHLTLNGKPATPLALKGMKEVDAVSWLEKNNFTEPSLVSHIIKETGCIPLGLKLAVRYVQDGNKMSDLPMNLSAIMVQGFFYTRILDRLIDDSLRPLAKDILIVRKVSLGVLTNVFHDALPEKTTPMEIFERLASEFALVTEARDYSPQTNTAEASAELPTFIDVRPEVRIATIKLLEQDHKARVEEIDRRAAKFFSSKSSRSPEMAAEAIYHFLRLGKINKAEKLWKPNRSKFLETAVDEIPEDDAKARQWLKDKLQKFSPTANLEVWELDALERVKSTIARGYMRGLTGILNENKNRTSESPLLVYDAWLLLTVGDLSGARRLLDKRPAPPEIEYKRMVLRAFLAAKDNDRDFARQCLEQLEVNTSFNLFLEYKQYFGEESQIIPLLLRAARLAIETDINMEMDLYKRLKKDNIATSRLRKHLILPESDVIFTPLSDVLYPQQKAHSISIRVELPVHKKELPTFTQYLDQQRADQIPHSNSPLPLIAADEHLLKEATDRMAFAVKRYPKDATIIRRSFNLAVLGWKRGRLAVKDLCLSDCISYIHMGQSLKNLLAISSGVISLHCLPMNISSVADIKYQTIDDLVRSRLASVPMHYFNTDVETVQLTAKFLETLKQHAGMSKLIAALKRSSAAKNNKLAGEAVKMVMRYKKESVLPVLLLILSPSPLERLLKIVLEIPDEETILG